MGEFVRCNTQHDNTQHINTMTTEQESIQLFSGPLDGQDVEIDAGSAALVVPYRDQRTAEVLRLIFRPDGNLNDGRRRFSLDGHKFPNL